ncbi:probable protein ABIL1 isoform X1 [Arachis ipaensis]|uniref:probable protein ABIL1 isoform X1 n=1 Tax=Arachis ipaensis TaxID=130454 RepID=UPI000A2B42BC|nr:probable protein ABIL1 isoform X1 [Arachis ipaensis]XP_020976527.1 probable protein ABIL1 isoform X1 [Arachis ipaensis]XP_025644844.1 probable protein ABIL1 isoform X1 [Arachis hypogaea]
MGPSYGDSQVWIHDNLKNYAVRALVMNVVDHLGTVAYKLTDLLDQQTLDVSTMDLRVSTVTQLIKLNQQPDTKGSYVEVLERYVKVDAKTIWFRKKVLKNGGI